MQRKLKLIPIGALLIIYGIHSSATYALDTSSEEAQCLDIGFKKKTPAFADCVLELVERKPGGTAESNTDDTTCRKYGFKPKSEAYAACRQQIDMARQDAERQQAQYAQQRAEYEAQLAEQKKERDRQRNMAMMQMGLGLLTGKTAGGAPGYGTIPQAPTPPQNMNRTYVLPGGKMMNCNTTGSLTTCF